MPGPRSAPLGRRKRRLRRVVTILAAVGAAAIAIGFWAYRVTRPTVRVPGEALSDITSRLRLDLPPEAPDPAFADVTEAAGLADFVAFAGARTSQLPEDMGAGGSQLVPSRTMGRVRLFDVA